MLRGYVLSTQCFLAVGIACAFGAIYCSAALLDFNAGPGFPMPQETWPIVVISLGSLFFLSFCGLLLAFKVKRVAAVFSVLFTCCGAVLFIAAGFLLQSNDEVPAMVERSWDNMTQSVQGLFQVQYLCCGLHVPSNTTCTLLSQEEGRGECYSHLVLKYQVYYVSCAVFSLVLGVAYWAMTLALCTLSMKKDRRGYDEIGAEKSVNSPVGDAAVSSGPFYRRFEVRCFAPCR